jgi:hypothetical protein
MRVAFTLLYVFGASDHVNGRVVVWGLMQVEVSVPEVRCGQKFPPRHLLTVADRLIRSFDAHTDSTWPTKS